MNLMKQIITIQHTQSVHHTNGMVGSWTDWDLTDLGRQQADNIGKKLADELAGKALVMYSSDLKRARQTAEGVAKYLGVEPILKQELRERNLGRCCGKSVQWLKENLEADEVTVDDRLFSDGESRRDAWNRLKPCYDSIMEDPAETIIVVAHGDILSSFFAMFLGLEVEHYDIGDMHGYAGGVSQLMVWDNGKRCIKKLSDMSYIG
jgi:probable phosphoglycerate mutase